MAERQPTPAAPPRTQAEALDRLMRPASIAVVGASPAPGSVGNTMLANVLKAGFGGACWAVNPKYEEIDGVASYPSLADLPAVPDAVLVGLGRERVVPAIEACAELGVPAAVVVAGGFGEADEHGRALERRLREVARGAGMALIGPNCQGTIHTHHRSACYLDTIPRPLERGAVALISESGTVTTALTNNTRGVAFSAIVSSGNEAVTDSADLLAWCVDDPATRIVLAFLETIRSPERFFAACDRAREVGKPVVVLKVGRSDAARAAATAHTGALAPPDRLVDARFRRHGVVRVDTLEQLLETAVALGGAAPFGPGVCVVTLSGGQSELILDAAAARPGLELPPLSPQTVAQLEALLPPEGHASNPLDLWGVADFGADYERALELVAADPAIDTLLACTETPSVHATGDRSFSAAVVEAVERVATRTGKGVALMTTLSGNVDDALQRRLAAQRLPLLSGVEQALAAVACASAFTASRAERREPLVPPPAPARDAAAAALGPGATSGLPALELLAAAGVPVVETACVRDVGAAVEAARRCGYPVVLKTGDPDVAHKTEQGGVVVGLRDDDGVRAAAARLLAAGGPRAQVLVQRQASGGAEAIVGLHRDAQLGAFVVLGLGGIWTELLDDAVMRPLPLRPREAAEMIAELRGSAVFAGARGAPPLDTAALAAAVEAVAALGVAHPRIAALDVNPLFVLPDGVLAVDALVETAAAQEAAA
ncbi:MAG: acetate--CoA ligase family protein [Actinobacteria bacterium]|nr:acetate--CoA ligase family protein [Actinomycetota bacterium]